MRSFLAPALLTILTLSLTACLNDDNGCSSPFTQSITPDEIRAPNQVFIGMDKLAFLFSGDGFRLDNVDLEADLVGVHKASETFTLSMNGIKLSRQDGHPSCDSVEVRTNDNVSESHFKLQNFALNGGIPFELFLLQLRQNKGRLQLQVNGSNINLKSAKVVFTGHTQVKCPVPPPAPPVPKVAAITTLGTITPSASLTNSSTISIAFSANQTGVTYYCSLDAATAVKCASPQAYAGLVSGAHDFKIYSVNAGGLKETPGADYKWTVDAVAPTVMISNLSQLKTLTNVNSEMFQFSSSKASTYLCGLDNAVAMACPNPQSYAKLIDGPHHFSVQAVDAVGNVSGKPATFDWSVDTVAPTTSITQVTPYDPISNVNTRNFQFTASESASFECSLDAAVFAACVSPVSLNNLSDGPHLLRVRATDLAGNVGVTVSASWTTDTTPPVLTLGQVSPAQGNTSASNVSVSFALNEGGQVYCAEDGAAAVGCASPFVWSDWSLGQHQLVLYAVDSAGNRSASSTLNWNVNNGGPMLSFAQILPSSNYYLNTGYVTFQIASDVPSTLAVRLNGTSISPDNPLVFAGLSDGGYTLYVTGTDSMGRVSDPLVHDFVVDTVAPSLTVTSDDSQAVTTLDHRTFSFTTNEDVHYLCNLDEQGFSACTTPLVLSGLSDGPHALAVQAIDPSGNTTEVDSSWIVQAAAAVVISAQ